MNELNAIIAKNLSTLRKKSQITQMQLAEKLNYSDKAVSKWEKGDCVPSIYVLMEIASFYGVGIEDIVYEKEMVEPKKHKRRLTALKSLLYSTIVWLVATIVFVTLTFFPATSSFAYLSFIVATPVFFFVLFIFSIFLKTKVFTYVWLSFFVWATLIAVWFILKQYIRWTIYLIGLPLQVMIILGLVISILKRKVK